MRRRWIVACNNVECHEELGWKRELEDVVSL